MVAVSLVESLTSGVLLSVIGAVQYGTSKVCYTIVPHFDAQE